METEANILILLIILFIFKKSSCFVVYPIIAIHASIVIARCSLQHGMQKQKHLLRAV